MRIKPSRIWGQECVGEIVWGYISTSRVSGLPIEPCLCGQDTRSMGNIARDILIVFQDEVNEIFRTTIVEHTRWIEHNDLPHDIERYKGSLSEAHIIIGRDIKGNDALERLKYEGGLGIICSSHKREEFMEILFEDPECLKPSDTVRVFVKIYSPLRKRDGDSEDKLLERMARRLRGYELKPVRFSLSIDCYEEYRKWKIDLNEVWRHWSIGESLFVGEKIVYGNPYPRKIISWDRYI